MIYGFCEGKSLVLQILDRTARTCGVWRGSWGRGRGNAVECHGYSHFLVFLTLGDDISIHADFENTCSRIVVPKAAIVARHTYLANGQTKVLTQKLSSVRGNHIISGTCASWRGKSLRVQKIRPSILGCNILRVEYSLLVSEEKRERVTWLQIQCFLYSAPSNKLPPSFLDLC